MLLMNMLSKVFGKRKASTDHWMDLSIGSSGCHLAILQLRKDNEIGLELYINDDKELFNNLFNKKDTIEKDAALSFDWRELPEKKASRIIIKTSADFEDKSKWNFQFDWIVDTSLKMRKAFKKYL